MSDRGFSNDINPETITKENPDKFGILFGKAQAVYVDTAGVVIVKKIENLRTQFPGEEIAWRPSGGASTLRHQLNNYTKVQTEIPKDQIVHLSAIGNILRIEKQRGVEVINITIKDKAAINKFSKDVMEFLQIPIERKLSRDVTGWGKALIIIGAISIISSFFGEFLSPIWGLFLIPAGIICLKIREPASLILCGIILIFAGLTNFAGGGALSTAGAIQVILGIVTIREARKYSRVYAVGKKDRALFALSSLFLTITAVIVLPLIILLSSIVFGNMGIEPSGLFIGYLFEFEMDLAAFGLATGIASLVSERRYKWAAVIGAIISGLIYLAILAVVFIGAFLPQP